MSPFKLAPTLVVLVFAWAAGPAAAQNSPAPSKPTASEPMPTRAAGGRPPVTITVAAR